MNRIIKLSSQVQSAITNHQPIVVLQSTILSHGMPYPDNKICTIDVENIIRKYGVQPATVAIFDGYFQIGLNQHMIDRLAKNTTQIMKVSRRDIPYIMMNRTIGATTVSATMIAAALANIEVFVTGGIGGIHRQYQETLDASADLKQLGRTPVTVVSAGVKSILDIPRTLQYLETQGVPVVSYNSKNFPTFFSASSTILSPFNINNVTEIAKMIMERRKLQMMNGMLVAVPTKDILLGQEIQKSISEAIELAHQQNIKGSKITPYLLNKVNELTKGKSLQANISLVKNNAQIGAQIAVELNKLQKQLKNRQKQQTKYFINKKASENNNNKLILIGGCAIDYQYKAKNGQKFELYQSCMGSSNKMMGGVARNIAQCASKLNTNTVLVSPLGNDSEGNEIRQFCTTNKIQLNQIISTQDPTAKYLAILDENHDEMLGISQMQINKTLTFDNIYEAFFKEQIRCNKVNTNDIIIIDANVDHYFGDELQKLIKMCNEIGYFIIFQCKGEKSNKIIKNNLYQYISMIRMNCKEKIQLLKKLNKNVNSQQQLLSFSSTISSKSNNKSHYKTNVSCIITNGSKPLQIVHSDGTISIKNIKQAKVEKTTGAGDTFTGVLTSMMLKGIPIQQAIDSALIGSQMTIQSKDKSSVISSKLSLESLNMIFNK